MLYQKEIGSMDHMISAGTVKFLATATVATAFLLGVITFVSAAISATPH